VLVIKFKASHNANTGVGAADLFIKSTKTIKLLHMPIT